jgi:cyclophilin family peptidyl-prolyl cis-trans isomerase
MIEIRTNHGTIRVELEEEKAPRSTANFLAYVDEGFYDGTIFHRVIPGFMIQGGGMTADLERKPTREPVENEAANGLENLRGTLAMARTADPDSATSQFFVNLKDNAFLNHGVRDEGYAVFARVAEGMDVVDAIAAVETGSDGYHQDVPVEAVVIESIRRVEAEEGA